jgi:hypothetical protein
MLTSVEASIFMMCVAVPTMFVVILIFVFVTKALVKMFPAKDND